MKKLTLYGPFSQLLRLENLPLKGRLNDEDLLIQRGQGILVEDGTIVEIGTFERLAAKHSKAALATENFQNLVALPAFVDCHTHICWGGTRVNDYAMRVAGKSYLEIAAAGGGIMDTVTATRAASPKILLENMLERIDQHIRRGIAVIEVKSGYGLTVADELKMLECIKTAQQETSATLIPTFLGAHIKPKDFEGSHAEYLELMLKVVIPQIMENGLAKRADIFVEEGAFGVNEARDYAKKLINLGFNMTMHVDQFHAGGSEMSAELGCVSADHLECTNDTSVTAIANSDTVAVALPGASIGLGMQFTPARKLLDAGASLAIATDWNPGSAPMGDLLTQASILGASEKLSIAETLAGITTRAAHALRVDAGTISIGKPARLSFFETDDFRNIFYQQGQLRPVFTVIGSNLFYNE